MRVEGLLRMWLEDAAKDRRSRAANARKGKFLGACVVEADDGPGAVARARAVGAHPGGHVLVVPIHPDDAARVPPPVDRLMQRAELEQVYGPLGLVEVDV